MVPNRFKLSTPNTSQQDYVTPSPYVWLARGPQVGNNWVSDSKNTIAIFLQRVKTPCLTWIG